MADDAMAGVYAHLVLRIAVMMAPAWLAGSELCGPGSTAAIIAVGSELLTPRKDRHQLALHHAGPERPRASPWRSRRSSATTATS